MSHAVALVALTPEDREGKTVEEAVATQLEPFREQDEWFEDGSRWDWYQIGGRYTGCLSSWDNYVEDVCLRSDITQFREGTQPTSAFAFVRGGVWHERARLGFFGAPALTECQIKSSEETGEEYKGRCSYTCPESGAKIVSYEDTADSDDWDQLYWPRFLRDLPLDTTIVVVDYHV